jgi:hypothetical protein
MRSQAVSPASIVAFTSARCSARVFRVRFLAYTLLLLDAPETVWIDGAIKACREAGVAALI